MLIFSLFRSKRALDTNLRIADKSESTSEEFEYWELRNDGFSSELAEYDRRFRSHEISQSGSKIGKRFRVRCNQRQLENPKRLFIEPAKFNENIEYRIGLIDFRGI